MWFDLAAKYGLVEARNEKARLSSMLNSDQVEKGKAMSEEWRSIE
jgi:hypothetical protein